MDISFFKLFGHHPDLDGFQAQGHARGAGEGIGIGVLPLGPAEVLDVGPVLDGVSRGVDAVSLDLDGFHAQGAAGGAGLLPLCRPAGPAGILDVDPVAQVQGAVIVLEGDGFGPQGFAGGAGGGGAGDPALAPAQILAVDFIGQDGGGDVKPRAWLWLSPRGEMRFRVRGSLAAVRTSAGILSALV